MAHKQLWPEIRARIERGESLNNISAEMKLPKSTIYEHYRRIRGLKIARVSIIDKSNDISGEVVGAFAGDGSFQKQENYHYKLRVYLSGDEEEYANTLYERMSGLFTKKPTKWRSPNVNNIILMYNSKSIYEWLRGYLDWGADKTGTICLKGKTARYPRDFLIGFLRGLLDTDGYVAKPSGYTIFATISPQLAKQTSQALNQLGIENCATIQYSQWRPLHIVRIKKKNAVRLLELLKPSNPKRHY